MNDTVLLDGLLKETMHYSSGELGTKRFKAALKKAPRLEDNGSAYGLPPGRSIQVFPVDMLPGAPEGWVREAGSYACPVDVGWGLWFDWTMNDQLNTAVLTSVKGMNPLTGRKFKDLALEQYANKCPVHKKAFKNGRLCEKCGYQWPPQNYVCAPNTLWWDGFRQPDGTVRQFVFTEQMKRDVASLVIGAHSVQQAGMAFGFAFYEPKVQRVIQASPSRIPDWAIKAEAKGVSGVSGYSGVGYPYEHPGPKGPLGFSGFSGFSGTSGYSGCTSGYSGSSGHSGPSGASGASGFSGQPGCSIGPSTPVKSYSDLPRPSRIWTDKSSEQIRNLISQYKEDDRKDVAVEAGARIQQDLQADPLKVTAWEEKPAAIMRLYFVFPLQFAEILEKGGIKTLNAKPEGYLAGIY